MLNIDPVDDKPAMLDSQGRFGDLKLNARYDYAAWGVQPA